VAGQDPTTPFDMAQLDFAEVLHRDGLQWGAAWGRATSQRYRAYYLLRVGRDPVPALDAAETDFTLALASASTNGAPWAGRGRTRGVRAWVRATTSGDPWRDFADGEADLRQATVRSHDTAPWEWLGDLLAHRGRARLLRGQDPAADFAAAEDSFARGIARSGSTWAYHFRGRLRTWRGDAEARAGRDPMDLWQQALRDLDQAVERDERNPDFLAVRAALRLTRARHMRSQADHLAAADDLRRALTLDPRHREARALAATGGHTVKPSIGALP